MYHLNFSEMVFGIKDVMGCQKPRCLCNLVMHEITDAPRIVVVCGAGDDGRRDAARSVSPFVRSFCSAKGKCSAFFAGKLVDGRTDATGLQYSTTMQGSSTYDVRMKELGWVRGRGQQSPQI